MFYNQNYSRAKKGRKPARGRRKEETSLVVVVVIVVASTSSSPLPRSSPGAARGRLGEPIQRQPHHLQVPSQLHLARVLAASAALAPAPCEEPAAPAPVRARDDDDGGARRPRNGGL